MSTIKIKKNLQRWLFGGIGFHNSEATMTPMMTDEFKKERVLKTFGEISPTFSRVYGGFSGWTKEAMDYFADYYDKTFRVSNTTLYLVPGRMPYITDDFDIEEYAEHTAQNIDYLINVRNCKKIRYFCVTNELSVGNTYAWFEDKLDLFGKIHDALHRAFKRHGLDIGLVATDASGPDAIEQIKWATDNIDEITDAYCTHFYSHQCPHNIGDPDTYKYLVDLFGDVVSCALEKQKRYILGEFGLTYAVLDRDKPMIGDITYSESVEGSDGICAVALAEIAVAVINSGTLSGVCWTMFDYPDPFLTENGETEEERARYDVARFSGHGMGIRYNKHGLIRWSDDEHDYSARASLYTMGYMAKLFRKNSRVMEIDSIDDKWLRCAAVTNADGSISIVVINWDTTEKKVVFDIEHNITKALRVYEFEAEAPPYNSFGDLQDYSHLIKDDNGEFEIIVKPKSVTFFTTDYTDRTPSAIKNVHIDNGRLVWDKCKDDEHCYYRIFASDEKNFLPCYENQIASTVAEYKEIKNEKLYYKVVSVDKFGNAGK